MTLHFRDGTAAELVEKTDQSLTYRRADGVMVTLSIKAARQIAVGFSVEL